MTLGNAITLLAYLVGGAIFYWQAKTQKFATNGIATLVSIGLLFGAIGAKLFEYLVSGLPNGIPITTILNPQSGGKTIIAGILIGWVAVEIAKWKMGIKRSTGDAFALALAAGESVGRIGCFVNPCCIGKECDLPWAVQQADALRHPSQLYHSALLFGVFLILLPLRNSLPNGALFQLYLVLWGLARFIVEFFRQGEVVFANLTLAQWFAIQTIVLSAIIFAYKIIKQKSQGEQDGPHQLSEL